MRVVLRRELAQCASNAYADDAASEDDQALGGREWQTSVRARALARWSAPRWWAHRRLRRIAWLIALVLHAALIVGLRYALQNAGGPPSADASVMHVDMIEPPLREPDLPEPLRARLAHPPRNKPSVAKTSAAARVPQVALAATDDDMMSPRIYQPDGTTWLPAAPDGFHVPGALAQYTWANIMRRNHNPLHCRRTDRDPAAFENVGDVIARNPLLSFLGLGNPYRVQLAQEREARAAQVCDEP